MWNYLFWINFGRSLLPQHILKDKSCSKNWLTLLSVNCSGKVLTISLFVSISNSYTYNLQENKPVALSCWTTSVKSMNEWLFDPYKGVFFQMGHVQKQILLCSFSNVIDCKYADFGNTDRKTGKDSKGLVGISNLFKAIQSLSKSPSYVYPNLL